VDGVGAPGIGSRHSAAPGDGLVHQSWHARALTKYVTGRGSHAAEHCTHRHDDPSTWIDNRHAKKVVATP
jgi:hypothetical protein